MGADNLRSFHRWQQWRKIVKLVPIVVIDRLGPSLYAAASPAGNALARVRIPEHDAAALPDRKPPVWAYLHGLKSPLSSTALRALRTQDGTPVQTGRKSSKSAKSAKGVKTTKRTKTGGKRRGKKAPKRKIAAKRSRRTGTKSRRRTHSRRRQAGKKSAR
jgi:nicotinate-nucleotide adenylyltransferase